MKKLMETLLREKDLQEKSDKAYLRKCQVSIVLAVAKEEAERQEGKEEKPFNFGFVDEG